MNEAIVKKCSVDGCKRDAFCKDMCESHYQKSRETFRKKCLIEGCGKSVMARETVKGWRLGVKECVPEMDIAVGY